ncbi:helix-turn-helix transcriptional regulator [Hymenobacter algoricola]|uniref:XRE family transcriptional regulator n=1 Tax=Hymenobacter algoricola TaxID=486267 RepID=A0ABP7NI20_9BACT
MARRAHYSSNLLAQVRRYFALHQQHLADLLGVSPGLIKHIEAGRRDISGAVLRGITPLALLVPEAGPYDATEFDDLPTAAPAPAELERRLRVCLHSAGQLRWKMRPLARRTRFAKRWQLVLPGLLAAAPAAAPEAAPVPRLRRWLLARQADAAADLDAYTSAQWHLLRVRAEALEAEAAALAALLPPE